MTAVHRRFALAYLFLVIAPIAGLAGVLRAGRGLTAPTAIGEMHVDLESLPTSPRGGSLVAASDASATIAQSAPNLLTLVLQIAVVLAACRLVGHLFLKIRQPHVVGEMFAGIMLGPSVLGWMAPEVSAFLFPASSLASLYGLSQIGLILFMFLVGLGINTRELTGQGHTAVLTSHASIIVPFALASLLALYLYPRLSDSSIPFSNFALFMGAAMSITAFPVLARILMERNMLRSRLGTVAITCAAVDDVTGWCILAYIVMLIRTPGQANPISMMVIIAFTLALLCSGQRLLKRFESRYRESGRLSENALALMLLLVLVAALCTEWLGIHVLFGAFLMGAIMPKEEKFVRYVVDKFETIVVTLLLPLFFAFTGLRTHMELLTGVDMWATCLLIIVVATLGKFGGAMLASWWTGLSTREAAGLSILMNTRGLMELVILNIGLDIKVISPTLFSMMVVMALATTFMTSPVLQAVCPDDGVRGREADKGGEVLAAARVGAGE